MIGAGMLFVGIAYRYGFNGKEKDSDGEWGNLTHYGFRIYNPGIGKFLSVDPLTSKYPYYTPYQFAGNMPIWAIDLDGLEPAPRNNGSTEGEQVETLGPPERSLSDEPSRATWIWHMGSERLGTKKGRYGPRAYENKVVREVGKAAGYADGYNTSYTDGLIGGFDISQYIDIPILSDNYGKLYGSAYNDGFQEGWSMGANAKSGLIIHTGDPITDLGPGLLKYAIKKAGLKIIGSPQSTGTWGHATYSKAIGWRYALDLRVKSVAFDLGYTRSLGYRPTNLLGMPLKWGPRPDVFVVFKSGRVNVFEVASRTDVSKKLFDRNMLIIKEFNLNGSVKIKLGAKSYDSALRGLGIKKN